ncbi:hypothetical protein J3P71_27575 (plasmid) [Rhizobium leguminosarum]|uniref:hypothetical protein n=1 Tax=Rhizobium leguminosarum TaxID=384 RepID=UPI001441F34E|nr:hypothetical protein [Rhizobium leguminosarum]MBY5835105.1 hypothetical protein [Rhizobium leguminosarum]MBY5864199.1 hypothetical protein [Rhizobium leguminosarum]NKM03213.1 hypothetical protein [Rhizobium leguminosarum bv. viciae]NKM75961.1 hypothetical protein [Rhizobium leguminosarum bv. viciae]QSZ11568.1 hypothetical protein J3P71_27575 [Rhizobium leguminosarum]
MLKDLYIELTTARYAAKAVNISSCCSSLSAPTRVTGQGNDVCPDRLLDQEVSRLVKKAASAAGVRPSPA